MSGKNIYKDYVEDSYYHIYNRGVNKSPIFKDDQDFAVFLALIKRSLSREVEQSKRQIRYTTFVDEIDLLAFCLMGNHFHLFIYQKSNNKAIAEFMRSITTAYVMYFNKKYKRVGPLFQQRYRAVRIVDDAQLLHISRYIHLNPDKYEDYEWSSYNYYLGKKHADWLDVDLVLSLFDGNYENFVAEYKDMHDELEQLKTELADS